MVMRVVAGAADVRGGPETARRNGVGWRRLIVVSVCRSKNSVRECGRNEMKCLLHPLPAVSPPRFVRLHHPEHAGVPLRRLVNPFSLFLLRAERALEIRSLRSVCFRNRENVYLVVEAGVISSSAGGRSSLLFLIAYRFYVMLRALVEDATLTRCFSFDNGQWIQWPDLTY